MKKFVTSDTHFGHHNIIRYTNRPFRRTAEMDSAMVERWNERVGKGDCVYFLGDFAMGPKVDENFILSKLYALNGIKLFIIGNHDKPNRKHRQKGLLKIVEENEVDVRFLNDIQEISHDGANFVLCHYPMNDWNGKFHGVIHLHGHAHTQFTPTRSRRQVEEKRYDVGVDMYGGPVELTGDLRYLNDPKGWE